MAQTAKSRTLKAGSPANHSDCYSGNGLFATANFSMYWNTLNGGLYAEVQTSGTILPYGASLLHRFAGAYHVIADIKQGFAQIQNLQEALSVGITETKDCPAQQ